MPTVVLTDLTVRSLGEGLHLDSRLPSFGIRVGKHRRTWVVLLGETRTKSRLGHYPALSLSEARRKALVALGTPFLKSEAPGFPDALDEFLSQDKWRPRAKYVLERSLRRHFGWQKALDKITHRDVAAVISGIKGKSAATHALKDIKSFFNWCVPRYLPRSPCEGLKGAPYRPRERLLSDDEVIRIWKAAEGMGAFGALVQVLFASGQRVGQFLAFDPAWLHDDIIEFPAGTMKGDRIHRLPIGPITESLLPKLHVMGYPGRRRLELDRVSGVKDWTLHDARRFYSSTQAKLGTDITTTEAILHHLSGSRSQIQRVYDLHDRLPAMRQAVARYEAHLAELLERTKGAV
jgi:hypothetical protein